MKAHISLIKKDLFLMGNYLCFIPVFTLVLPFFYYWRLPDFSLQQGTGLLLLIVASVYSEFLNAGIWRRFFPEYTVVLHTYASPVSVRL